MGRPAQVLLHFHNCEALAAHGQGRRSTRSLARQTRLLTRYALVVCEGRLIILPKFLWETSYFETYLRSIGPLISAGLIAYGGTGADFSLELPDKLVQYRDHPQLFAVYGDPAWSERQLRLIDRLTYVRRVGPSATVTIARAWEEGLSEGNDLAVVTRELADAELVAGREAERRLAAVPERLQGRAFVLSEVHRIVALPLDVSQATRLNWVINRAYLKLCLMSMNAHALVDTPLGAFDFDLRSDPDVAHHLISFDGLARYFASLGLKSTIEKLPWRELVELRYDPAFRLIAESVFRAASPPASTTPAPLAVALDRKEVAEVLLRSPPENGVPTLKQVRQRLAWLLEVLPVGVLGDGHVDVRAIALPARSWRRRRRGESRPKETPVQLPLLDDPPVLMVGVVTIKTEEFSPLLDRLGSGKDERWRRWYRVVDVPMEPSGHARVVVVNAGEQGGVSAVDCARDLLEDFDVDFIALVGIGGGLPSLDYTLGDVVVARAVQDLRVRALLADGSEEFSTLGVRVSRLLTDVLDYLPGIEHRIAGWSAAESIGVTRPQLDVHDVETYGPPQWQEQVRETLRTHFGETNRDHPKTFVGPIVSSDALIKSAEFAQTVREMMRHTAAFEMEAAGIFKAADRVERNVPVLVAKGISDLVGLKRNEAWTHYAANTAAAWLVAMIRSGVLAETLGGSHHPTG